MDKATFDPAELPELLAALTSNHDDLGVRLRTLTLTAKSMSPAVRLHGHYFPFRGGKPTVEEFIDLLTTKLVSFCMSRKSIKAAHDTWRELSPEKQIEKVVHLRNRLLTYSKRHSATRTGTANSGRSSPTC